MAAAGFFLLAFATGHAQTVPTSGSGKSAAGDSAVELSFPNFNEKGQQLVRFSTLGDAVDAHDGEIAYFDGTYYLYGTSYDCGFQWGDKHAPFCGFKVYASKDLVNWKDEGFLFDAQTPVWQSRCDGSTYGCFRPHVIYNRETGKYVLWINVYDNQVGYRVFTSKTPVGPFKEVANPVLAINKDAPVAGLNNGDHDTFVDDDGTAYLAYTDWHTNGTIVIEKLTPDYLSGTGQYVKNVTPGKTEAPALFKRKGIYYLLYSDPNCGYCGGTGTSYRTAATPLGPWSAPVRISDSSCGGQPSFVATIQLPSGAFFLFGSDLWNNAAKNEALANYFWTPLTFNSEGGIDPIRCDSKTYTTSRSAGLQSTGNAAVEEGFVSYWDIGRHTQRAQTFKADFSGRLKSIALTTFKNGNPDAGLKIAVYKAAASGQPEGESLAKVLLPASELGWSAEEKIIPVNVKVDQGSQYLIVISTDATMGLYGFAYNDQASDPAAHSGVSHDEGKTFHFEPDRQLRLKTTIARH